MKMTKKLIPISVILAMAMTLGLVGVVKAGGADVVFDDDTKMDIYRIGTTIASDLVVEAASQVAGIVRDTDRVTITLESGSDITFKSAGSQIMTVTNCGAGFATFHAGTPSTMHIVHDDTCDTNVVLTIGTGGLTEGNVKATPLTAGEASVYTVTFKTVSALTAGQKIKLAFGTGYGIAANAALSTTGVAVTDETGTSTAIASTFESTIATREVIITLTPAVAASRVIEIVLTSVVTNPSTLTHNAAGDPTMSVLGIDIYTTTSGGNTIDSLADQTPYNRIIELKPGWNIFAPSQVLETPAYATVILPITSYVKTIYTLTRGAGTMVWETPTTIDPLYAYAIYITGSVNQDLPLDFAKEIPGNFARSRDLEHKGWFLIGYMGNGGSLNAFANCLDGLVATGVNGTNAYDVIIDLTGQTTNNAQTNHFWAADPLEQADGAGTMLFTKDYGFAVSVNTTGMTLTGNREEG